MGDVGKSFRSAPPQGHRPSASPRQGIESRSEGIAATPTCCPNGHPVAPSDTSCSRCGTVAPTEPLPAAEAPALPFVPGYQVLGVLGRGGMGVVYKARQLGLNRLVALKMIRGGILAGPEERARFRAEAEAVARLQHPNIVHVHQLGEHCGQPFFSLELCEGGSLDKMLAGQCLPPRQAAELIETLAGAVQAAHEAGVLHRDLKPANVLLGRDGVPKVTDFGLAKKLNEPGQTQSGVVVGTPCYMAPEQARGEKALGPAADVYALGVILYESLTGRPPFRAATVMETLMQVMSEEPTPPRRLQPAVPVDLEAICLRCLEKLPTQRYPSAAALAQDVGRFLDGRPTAARPVSSSERLLRWVRRRPIGAALSATLLLLALGGSAAVVGWRLEVVAAHEKDIQAGLRQDAERAERERQQADEAEDRRVDGLLRTVGQSGGALTPAERKTFHDLAAADEHLRLRFLAKGLQRPESAARLSRRSEQVVQALVGLDLSCRQKAIEVLRERLSDEQSDPTVRSSCVLVGAALGLGAREDFCREGVKVVEAAMARTNDPHELARLGEAIGVLAVQLGPQERTQAATRAAGQLVDATSQKDPKSLEAMVHALIPLAAWVSTEATAAQVERLRGEIGATTDPKALARLVQAAAALSGRLGQDQVERLADAAADRIDYAALLTGDPMPFAELSSVLAALPGEKAARNSQQVASALVGRMTSTTAPADQIALSRAVLALADGVTPEVREGLLAAATRQLLVAVFQAGLPHPGGGQVDQLPPAVANAYRPRPGEPGGQADAATLYRLLQTLDRLTERLPPGAGLQAAIPLVGGLTAAVSQPTSPVVACILSEAVVRLQGPLPPQLAEMLANQLLAVMPQASDPHALAGLVRATAALAERMPAGGRPRLDGQLAVRLLDAVDRTADPYALAGLGQAVAVLQSHGPGTVPAQRLAAAVDRLLGVLSRTSEPGARVALGRALAGLASRLRPEQREQALAAAADRLTESMAETDDLETLRDLLGTVTTLLGQPGQEKRRVAALRRALEVPAALEREAETLADQLSTESLVILLGEPASVGQGRRFLLGKLAQRIGPPPSAIEGAAAAVAVLPADPLLSLVGASCDAALYPGGHRPFADVWEAVDYLQAHYPQLLLSGSR